MTGLARPYAGSHLITQGFTGHNEAEPVGYLAPGALRAQHAWRSGWARYDHLHMAQDVAMPIGTPLLAPANGYIVAEGTYSSTGEHFVMLRFHRDASIQTVLFCTHIMAGGLIHPVGYHAGAGAEIAFSGNSGMSSGPHLHWEVRVGPAAADPHLSAGWVKYDPEQCLTGGALAGAGFLVPNV